MQRPYGVEVQDEEVWPDELHGSDDAYQHLDQEEDNREGIEMLRDLLAFVFYAHFIYTSYFSVSM